MRSLCSGESCCVLLALSFTGRASITYIDIMLFVACIVMPANQFIVMPRNQLSTTCSSNDCLGLWCAQTRMAGTVGIKGDANADYYCTVLAKKSLSIDKTSNEEMVHVLHCAVGVIHKLRSE